MHVVSMEAFCLNGSCSASLVPKSFKPDLEWSLSWLSYPLLHAPWGSI
jgi:hypothetical protein